MTFGFPGSIASDPQQFDDAMGFTVLQLIPPSVVFKMPGPAAYSVLGLCGLIASAVALAGRLFQLVPRSVDLKIPPPVAA
jgi:hypothetical protein